MVSALVARMWVGKTAPRAGARWRLAGAPIRASWRAFEIGIA